MGARHPEDDVWSQLLAHDAADTRCADHQPAEGVDSFRHWDSFGGCHGPLEHGAGERNRTADLRITSALLYQLSYTSSPCGPRAVARGGIESGATPQNRTADTRIFSAVLYQLS